MQELVSSGQLNVSSEEKVFHAVLNWVKHDLPSRETYVAKVRAISYPNTTTTTTTAAATTIRLVVVSSC